MPYQGENLRPRFALTEDGDTSQATGQPHPAAYPGEVRQPPAGLLPGACPRPEGRVVADKFITVATFSLPYEAELAKSLLENEGIESFLTGGLSVDVLLGAGGMADQVRLQVHDQDAQRAAGILAAHQAALEDGWEDKAEHDPDVWVCSLCGSPVSNGLSACLACQTPREGIRADLPSPVASPRQALDVPPTDSIQKREDFTADARSARGGRAPSPPRPAEAEGEDEAFPEAQPGEELARR